MKTWKQMEKRNFKIYVFFKKISQHKQVVNTKIFYVDFPREYYTSVNTLVFWVVMVTMITFTLLFFFILVYLSVCIKNLLNSPMTLHAMHKSLVPVRLTKEKLRALITLSSSNSHCCCSHLNEQKESKRR